MRQLDTTAYVSALRELVEAGQEVSMTIAGGSMAPFLVNGRDAIRFKAPDRPLKPGDMVFYQRENGQFVMHRICRVAPEGVYLVGDAQWHIEGPLAPERIFALVIQAQRKGKWIGPGDFWWEFFARVWIRLIPLRPGIVKLYTRLRGRKD